MIIDEQIILIHSVLGATCLESFHLLSKLFHVAITLSDAVFKNEEYEFSVLNTLVSKDRSSRKIRHQYTENGDEMLLDG